MNRQDLFQDILQLTSEHLVLVLASVAILGAIVLIRRGERTVSVEAPETVPVVAEVKASQECA